MNFIKPEQCEGMLIWDYDSKEKKEKRREIEKQNREDRDTQDNMRDQIIFMLLLLKIPHRLEMRTIHCI